jgi:hypothetical protein
MPLPGGKTPFAFAAGTTYLDHGGFGVAPREVLRRGEEKGPISATRGTGIGRRQVALSSMKREKTHGAAGR